LENDGAYSFFIAQGERGGDEGGGTLAKCSEAIERQMEDRGAGTEGGQGDRTYSGDVSGIAQGEEGVDQEGEEGGEGDAKDFTVVF